MALCMTILVKMATETEDIRMWWKVKLSEGTLWKRISI